MNSRAKTCLVLSVFLLVIPAVAHALAPVSPTALSADDQFGKAVAVSGDLAVIGAYGDDTNGSKAGAAYIFQRSGTSWTQQAKLLAEDGLANDWFGSAVAMEGYTVVVGAEFDDDTQFPNTGAVYVFTLSGGSWVQSAKLTAGDAGQNDNFGTAVAISGDTIVVGAKNDDDMGASSGAVYVFQKENTGWTQKAKLLPSEAKTDDIFGASVSISGDYIIVGAPGRDDQGISSGAAYIYTRPVTGWSGSANWAKLSPTELTTSDLFGTSVSISGTRAMVGAENAGTGDKGVAYVFTFSGGAWSQTQMITPDDGAAGDSFGASVSISGDYALVGAPAADPSGISSAGAAYMYTVSGSTWSQDQKLTADDGAAGNLMGESVSISGYYGVIGAPNKDQGAELSTGAAYFTDRISVDLNLDPTISPIGDQLIIKNGSTTETFFVWDAETPAGSLTVDAVSFNTTVVPNPTITGTGSERTITINTVAGATGTSEVTVTVTDGNGNTAQDIFLVTVYDPPTITGLDTDPVIINVNETKDLTFSISDATTPADNLVIDLASSNPVLLPVTASTLWVEGTGQNRTLKIVPVDNETGESTITVTVTDTDGDATSKSFTLQVNGGPAITAPVTEMTILESNPDNLSDAMFEFTVSDAEGGLMQLSYTSDNLDLVPEAPANIQFWDADSNDAVPLNPDDTFTLPINGSASLGLTIIPMDYQSGTANIDIAVTDDNGATSHQVFTVTVTPVNDAPEVSSIQYNGNEILETDIITVNEDQVTDPIEITIEDMDGNNGTLTLSAGNAELVPLDAMNNGYVTVDGQEINSTDPIQYVMPPDQTTLVKTLLIRPQENVSGITQVTLTVEDSEEASSTRSFYFEVINTNDAPVITGFPATPQTIEEDSTGNTYTFTVSDIEGDALTLSIESSNPDVVLNQAANLNINGVGPGGELIISTSPGVESDPIQLMVKSTENANTPEDGTTTITVTADDGKGGIVTDSFELEVTPTDDPPAITAFNDIQTPEETSTGPLDFTISDPDGDDPLNGGGPLTVTVQSSDTALVPVDSDHVLITGPNDFTTSSPRTINTLTNDSAAMKLEIIPAENQTGTALITVTVSDSDNLSAPSSFYIEVTNTNDPPEILGLPTSIVIEEDVEASFPFTISDPDSPVENLIVNVQSLSTGLIPDDLEHLSVTGSGGSRTLNIKSAQDVNSETFGGSGQIQITVDDGEGGILQSPHTVTVNPANDPPAINQIDPKTTQEDTPITFPITITDDEGGDLEVSVISSTNTTLLPVDNDHVAIEGIGTTYLIADAQPGIPYTLDLTLTPAAEQFGNTQVTITASDGEQSDTGLFTFSVSETNDAPEIIGLPTSIVIDEDVEASFPFTISDPDTPIENLIVSVQSLSSGLIPDDLEHLSVTGSGGSRTLNIKSAQDVNSETFGGSGQIQITVDDGEGGILQSPYTVTVNPANDPPAINQVDPKTTQEDTPITFPITITDDEGGDLEVSVISSTNTTLLPVDNDHVAIEGIGTTYLIADAQPGTPYTLDLTLTPAAEQFGNTQVAIAASDGEQSETVLFTLSVSQDNDVPEISGLPDPIVIDEDVEANLPFTVTDPDTSVENVAVSAQSLSTGLIPNDFLHISVTGSGGSRTLFLKSAQDVNSEIFGGSGQIQITADDGVGGILQKTYNVTVNPTNDPPTIDPIGAQNTEEDTPVTFPITITDAEGGDLQVSVISSSNSTLLPVDNEHVAIEGVGTTYLISDAQPGVPTTVNLTLTPANDQSGSTQITVSAGDGDQSATRTFKLDVTASNDAPIITRITNKSTEKNVPTDPIPFTISDAEGGTIKVVASSDNQTLVPDDNIDIGGFGNPHTFDLAANGSEDLSLVITPAEDESGTAMIRVEVYDPETATTVSAFVEFLLTVSYVNEPPLLDPITPIVMQEDVPETVGLTIYDLEGGTLTVSVVSETPAVVPNDSTHLDIDGLGNVYYLTLAANETKTVPLVITPALHATGSATLTVTVTDQEDQDQEPIYLTIDPDNDPPTIDPVPTQSTDENTPTGSIPITISDIEGGTMEVIVNSLNETLLPNSPSNINIDGYGTSRTITVAPNGSTTVNLVLTPAADQSGQAYYTVTVNDPPDPSAPDRETVTSPQFLLQVNYENRPPEITDIPNQNVGEDETVTVPVTITDPEGGTITVTASSNKPLLYPDDINNISINGFGPSYTYTASPGVPQTIPIQFTPVKNQFDIATITITADDGQAVNETLFLITVQPRNDAPIVSNIPNQETEENTPVENIPFTIQDVDGGTLTITVTSLNETLVSNDLSHIDISGFGTTHEVTLAPGETENLTLTLTPNEGASGSGQIVVSVTDDSEPEEWPGYPPVGTDNSKTEEIFTLTVNDAIEPPTISDILNQVINEDEVLTLSPPITISDEEGGEMVVTVTSSNTSLVPNDSDHIKLSEDNINFFGQSYVLNLGTGPASDDLYLKIIPAENRSGTTEITVTVEDGVDTATKKFQLAVNPAGDPPTVDPIPNEPTDIGVPVTNIPITVSDPEGGDITVAVEAGAYTTQPSQPLILNDAAHIDLGGFGLSRVVTVQPGGSFTLSLDLMPEDGISGSQEIKVTAWDNTGLSDQKTFLLMVAVENQPPVITGDQNVSTDEDTPVDIIFSVTDVEGGGLPVTIISSNTTLVPVDSEHIRVLDGTEEYGPNFVLSLGPNETRNLIMRITPAAEESGSAQITVHIDDGDVSAELVFYLLVDSQRDQPIVSTIEDQKTKEDIPISVPFTVEDPDTPLESLIISASSGNTTVVPNTNIAIGGSGNNRTIDITPAANAFGMTGINLTVSDGTTTPVTRSFVLNVISVLDEPVISQITSPKFTNQNEAVTIGFTVTDPDTPASSLVVNTTSSDQTVVPDSNIALTCTSGNCNMIIDPGTDQTGSAEITIYADDGQNIVTSTFTLNVLESPNAPKIKGLVTPQQTDEDVGIIVPFTLEDADTDLNSLVVSRSSTNTDLVPNNNIILGGSGGNRTASITPADNQFGETVITLTVTDGQFSSSASFTVQVASINDAPTVTPSPIPNQITTESEPISVNFTVDDVETAVQDLEIWVSSTNQALFPDTALDLTCTSGNCTLNLSPEPGQSGSSTITVNVKDDSLAVNSTTSEPFTVTVGAVADADVNCNGLVDLEDAILALQTATGIFVDGLCIGSDVNGDLRIGLPEAIFALQKVAGLR